ncbi:XF1762 family protein [Muricoccus nepalensis]|nr:XF1762 family protein [Roseomonas nepalensis]
MVGNPVARGLMGRGTVEVNRLCIRRDIPRPLAWNACSQLYGWAAREAEARGFERIVTYTRADEEGGSLRACGWITEAHVRGRSWNSPTRARTDRAPLIDKHRWSRALRPRRPVPRPPVLPNIMPLSLDAAA